MSLLVREWLAAALGSTVNLLWGSRVGEVKKYEAYAKL